VSTEGRLVIRGKLEPCPQNDVIAGIDLVRENLHRPGVAIVDARDLEYYTGARHADGKRGGHIPGARGLTYSTLLDESGKFRSPELLAAMFRDAGIQPGDRVVAYCHIGQQATVVYLWRATWGMTPGSTTARGRIGARTRSCPWRPHPKRNEG